MHGDVLLEVDVVLVDVVREVEDEGIDPPRRSPAT